ncbi:MAG: isoaspartyl peptidase/L-asparaginase [Candidatus Heimdallarchaeota archaeon]|nr:isoaspartyl peptidase/L-asparaginase [Candidatus Heimdallarchaeota archaeon]
MSIIVVHGGAGRVSDQNRRSLALEGVKEAVQIGWDILNKGGSAVDAVEAAVVSMENNPNFNAGLGSVVTRDKTIEMDALIMDGSTREIGGVIGISRVKNPITLSRHILDKETHVLFFGEHAEKLWEKYGFQLINPDELFTDRILQRYENFMKDQEMEVDDPEGRKYGTVGAVALDANGNLAAATSTGGVLGKMTGRVGDTPIIGAGTYADEDVAVSATGIGEYIIKGMMGINVKIFSQTNSFTNACDKALSHFKGAIGKAGLIAVNNKGEWSARKTTQDLIFAKLDDSGLEVFDV